MTRTCADCATPISRQATEFDKDKPRDPGTPVEGRAETEVAATISAVNDRSVIRTCLDCPAPIWKDSTRCRGCAGVGRPWSPEEDAVLRLHYLHGGIEAAIRHLSKRSRHGIVQRASKLGVNRGQAAFPVATVKVVPIVRAVVAPAKPPASTLSPFERQDRALRNGAALVANVRVAVR